MDGIQKVTAKTSVTELVYMLAYMSAWSTLTRADVVRRYGGFFDKDRCCYAEDAMLWLTILLNEPVYFGLRPLAIFHREASGLSANYERARPIEPFLTYPAVVAEACPADLLPLLSRFYAFRACKTAAVLGYWGQWRAARLLLREFVTVQDWRLPYFVAALIGCTPIAGVLGQVAQACKRSISVHSHIGAETPHKATSNVR